MKEQIKLTLNEWSLTKKQYGEEFCDAIVKVHGEISNHTNILNTAQKSWRIKFVWLRSLDTFLVFILSFFAMLGTFGLIETINPKIQLTNKTMTAIVLGTAVLCIVLWAIKVIMQKWYRSIMDSIEKTENLIYDISRWDGHFGHSPDLHQAVTDRNVMLALEVIKLENKDGDLSSQINDIKRLMRSSLSTAETVIKLRPDQKPYFDAAQVKWNQLVMNGEIIFDYHI